MVANRPWLERYLEARHHVRSGRTVINAQLDLIARRKAAGVNTGRSEDLLNAFERTQAIFEDDLERIVREGR
jgi:hypothetical protein